MPTPVLLPWADENNTGSSNTKQRVRTIALTNVTAEADGAIRPEERINATVYTAADSKRHLLKKNIGATEFDSISMYTDMDTINVEDHNDTPSFNIKQNDIQPVQQDHDEKGLQPIQQQKNESLVPFKPNVDKPNLKRNIDFFDRVDELKAYKEKHGHLNVSHNDDSSLAGFCYNVRQARKGKGTHRLDDIRMAALDAIGFNWELGDGGSSIPASKDDSFFDKVDKLRAYKEKLGHLNVLKKDDKSLYGFCYMLRATRRAILTGEGRIHYSLDDSRIAALDAIGFDWELGVGGSSTAASMDDKFFAQVDKLRAYKEKHGHLKVRPKDDKGLYGFCRNLRQARKGKGTNRLDETRIAALDAIGFNWDPLELKMSSTSPSAMTSKSTQQATNPKINVGDVGYRFLKEFDSGWYNGTVVQILPHAIGGLDRRCVYEDGDCEDLTLNELKRLATLSSDIEVVRVDGGGVKEAATKGLSIPAAKEKAVRK